MLLSAACGQATSNTDQGTLEAGAESGSAGAAGGGGSTAEAGGGGIGPASGGAPSSGGTGGWGTGGSAGLPDAGPLVCPPGLVPCGDACADLHEDTNHCGDCSTRCDAGAVCAVGHCASPYFLNPGGNDSHPGTKDQPWKTFAFALAKLGPGTALVLQDGTYTANDTGFVNIDCAPTATACAGGACANGTASAPIAVLAEHERRAFLQADGSQVAFVQVRNCSHWTFSGLRTEGGDTLGGASILGEHYYCLDSSHLVFRRLLMAKNNRYYNSHLMELYGDHHLVEECELYEFHRHGILHRGAAHVTYRRNYMNGRLHADLPDGRPSGMPDRADVGISVYPGASNLLENNISEQSGALADIQAIADSSNNRFLGNVSVGDSYGLLFSHREEAPSIPPSNTEVIDFVAVAPEYVGLYARGSHNTRCDRCSVFNGPSSSGIVADLQASLPNPGNSSLFATNTLVMNPTTSYGIRFVDQVEWGSDFTNVSGAAVAYEPDDNTSTNRSTAAPSMGTCLVRVPDASPLQGAGKDGADIGANVVYRYVDGTLTTEPLWDAAQGYRFAGCGAVVAGVNDDPETSCIGVARRLHVGSADPAAVCVMPY